MFHRPQRRIPEINASSTADIAFLLLIFFLLTTSMDTDRGLQRRLPPPGRPTTEVMKLRERNVLTVDIGKDDRVKCAGDYVDLPELRERAKLFIANSQDDPDLPERVLVDIPFLGRVRVTKHHVIALRCSRLASYRTYIAVQDELAGAYRDLRDELAHRKWNRDYASLSPDQQEAVRRVFPQQISEVKSEVDNNYDNYNYDNYDKEDRAL
ncbi:MAG TPA: biopolymer transporter ExbD [Candidatus Bacteroides merdigallinarum]|uniref:Biopolymer transporter ExbD n=1 Tax=Candidatus Bacteroides merdigallinarum TaxID=2838473 RepID=A0A9D2EA83_9BACE|nr:biopolymer transporter ExbD [Candidatus Bacteroides merdigallinarum]